MFAAGGRLGESLWVEAHDEKCTLGIKPVVPDVFIVRSCNELADFSDRVEKMEKLCGQTVLAKARGVGLL
jgi:hypothetical protein